MTEFCWDECPACGGDLGDGSGDLWELFTGRNTHEERDTTCPHCDAPILVQADYSVNYLVRLVEEPPSADAVDPAGGIVTG